MNKYKIVKRQIIKTSFEYVDEKIPTWYYKFLLWLFGFEEERIKKIIETEREFAWSKGFDSATKNAHSSKELFMQKELYRLGYDVICNFPMAKLLDKEACPDNYINPSNAWELKEIKN